MLAAIASATLNGALGRLVSVEVHVSNGLPGFTIVGLPDAAVREARDRVRAAVLSSGLSWPLRRVTVNLAPSGVRKGGAGLDLPIAVGLLVATGEISQASTEGLAFCGELGLNGSLRHVPGDPQRRTRCRRDREDASQTGRRVAARSFSSRRLPEGSRNAARQILRNFVGGIMSPVTSRSERFRATNDVRASEVLNLRVNLPTLTLRRNPGRMSPGVRGRRETKSGARGGNHRAFGYTRGLTDVRRTIKAAIRKRRHVPAGPR
jgi:Subunit ChlI of Mg-chelatase